MSFEQHKKSNKIIFCEQYDFETNIINVAF